MTYSETDTTFALEPCTDNHTARFVKTTNSWPPPCIIQSVAGRVRIPNLTGEPLVLKRRKQFCQVQPVFLPPLDIDARETTTRPAPTPPRTPSSHSMSISLDPDNTLAPEMRAKFGALHEEYGEVFDPTFP